MGHRSYKTKLNRFS